MLAAAFPILLCVAAASGPVEADRTGAPYFLIEGSDRSARLPLEESRADVSIAGVIARVQVTQVWHNLGGEPIEAVYVFPGSTRAAVFGMRMKVGERVIEAKIDRKAAAEKLYEDAKRQGKTASLLSEERPNVFTMKVANILPGDRIETVLDYTELVLPTDGVYELVYPAVVGPRFVGEAPADEGWTANPHLPAGSPTPYRWHVSGKVAAGMPLQAIQSPSHDLSPRFSGSNQASFELDDGGDRDLVVRYRLAGDAIDAGLLLFPGKDEGYFLLQLEPPARVAPGAVVPREYVFVVDVSGSMSGFPLNTAKQVLRDLLAGLRPEDSFNVLLFSGGNKLLAPKSLPATKENVERAIGVIDREHGGGGTELLAALTRVLALPHSTDHSTSIVVVTDGYVSVERRAFELVRDNLGKANLFAFGIGSSVNRFLIEGLARAGMGEPFVVLSPAGAAVEAARFKRYIESPVLQDVKLSYDGFDALDVEPPAVPDLFAARPLTVFGKYRGQPKGSIQIQGRAAGSSYFKSVDVSASKPSDDLGALRYLWARHRIARLSDLNGADPSPEIEQQITQLGLEHSLLTAFTSFVAIDSLVRNTSGNPRSVRQAVPMPKGVSNAALNKSIASSGTLGALKGVGMGGGGSGLRSITGGETRTTYPYLMKAEGSGSGDGPIGGGGSLGGRGKSAARVAAGQSVVMGSISKEAISRVIKARMGQFKYCYERQLLKDPTLAGKVVLRFVIGEDGRVLTIQIDQTSLASEAVESCLLQVGKKMVFPAMPGGGSVTVNYPLIFLGE